MEKQSEVSVSRRKFLTLAGIVAGSTALAPLIQACDEQVASPTPTLTSGLTSTAGLTGTVGPTTLLPVPSPTVLPLGQPVASYMAVVPAKLRSGQAEKIAVTLFSQQGQSLATDNVSLHLLKDGQSVAVTSGLVQGRDDLTLNLPASLNDGDYTLQFQAATFQTQAQVRVEQAVLVFLEDGQAYLQARSDCPYSGSDVGPAVEAPRYERDRRNKRG